MKNTSPEVDAYVASAAKFAQPILKKVRRLFHQACPAIQETMKWSSPCFEYKGLVAGMAAFKKHVRIGFWKSQLMRDPHKLSESNGSTAYGALLPKDVSELPDDDMLLDYIRQAIELNEQGVKGTTKKKPKPKLVVPPYFLAALKTNDKARAAFEGFSPSHQREYVEWITEAKQPATRERRMAQAIEWVAAGKPRNWKYM